MIKGSSIILVVLLAAATPSFAQQSPPPANAPAQARQAFELGFFVSFTGIVTFKNANAVREAAAVIPLDRIMVETDAPFLAPLPYRGKRCEPAFVKETSSCIARLRGIQPEAFAAQTTLNAEGFFWLPRN